MIKISNMEKMKLMIKKILTNEVILYILFGFFTTTVNLVTFFIMNFIFKWNNNISNAVAILLAALFAYITNRKFVFHSKAITIKEKIMELIKFMTGRFFTIIIEFIGGMILFKLPIPNIIIKIVLTVAVIMINFFISKFYAFKSKRMN